MVERDEIVKISVLRSFSMGVSTVAQISGPREP